MSCDTFATDGGGGVHPRGVRLSINHLLSSTVFPSIVFANRENLFYEEH
jgi:hypothetical protein